MIMQLLHSDWPDFLAGWHFRAQENGQMSPDGVCVISAGPAGHETNIYDTKIAPTMFYLSCKCILIN